MGVVLESGDRMSFEEEKEEELLNHPQPSFQTELRRVKKWFAMGLILCILISSCVGFLAGSWAGSFNRRHRSVMYQSTAAPLVNQQTQNQIQVSEVAKTALPSVVEVATERVSNSLFLKQFVTQGAGSGVILSEDGYIVTNNHVIDSASTIKVRLSDGTSYPAELIGSDSRTDIAILKIDATGLASATLGDSTQLIVGQPVVAIGNPLGNLGGSVTDGIISALDRELILSNEHRNLLQTNAAINPGNSGGGLFNSQGELIGIVVAKSSGSDIEGLGFVIPINDIKPVIDDLINKGYVTGRVFLGISVLNLNTLQSAMSYGYSQPGVYIQEVIENTSAQSAGFQKDDRIISINDMAIESTADITKILNESAVNDELSILIQRQDKILTLSLTLQERTN